MTLIEANQLSEADFVLNFGHVLEHSSRYAERVALARPFASFTALCQAFLDAIRADDAAGQLALIRAHPDLAGKAAIAGELTVASHNEQASAGLDQLSPEEFAEFNRINRAYHAKFEMPFIICVREHDKESIMRSAAQRLEHDPPTERQKALEEIGKIARLRLRDLLEDA